ncbi:tetratricopeptide repeat protein [Inmirania thermothiophila]|uniref:Tetratricopeptide repeat protein n=1 Tax=Inmirania thermothiophila TaxID=1750597 RepID=A0A3N1XS66_9GAMM|nr:tetratricopeptide repeat protein [Inmirania thermothiophila]ROR29503.1 tetratricopeptide repeat protein [Inmirania thermothiophila]
MALSRGAAAAALLLAGTALAAPGPEALVAEILAAHGARRQPPPPPPGTPRLDAAAALAAGDLEGAARLLQRLAGAPELHARLALARGAPEAALAHLAQAPGPEATLLRAIALHRLGRPAEAISALDRAPPPPAPSLGLAAAELALRQGRADEALARLRPLPPDPPALRLAARALDAQGEAAAALAVRMHLALRGTPGSETARAAERAAAALLRDGAAAAAADLLARALGRLEAAETALALPQGPPGQRLAAACGALPEACRDPRLAAARELQARLRAEAVRLEAAADRLAHAAPLVEARPREVAAAARRLAPRRHALLPLPEHPLDARLATLLDGPPEPELHRLYLGLVRAVGGRRARGIWWRGRGDDEAAEAELAAVEAALARLEGEAGPPYGGLAPRLAALADEARTAAARLRQEAARLEEAMAQTVLAAVDARRARLRRGQLRLAARLGAIARAAPAPGAGRTLPPHEAQTVAAVLALRPQHAPPPPFDFGRAARALRRLAAAPEPDTAAAAAEHLAALLLASGEAQETTGRPLPGVDPALAEAAALYGRLAGTEADPGRRARLRYQQAHAADLAADLAGAARALETAAADADGALATEIWFRLGETRFTLGRYAEAADAYSRALEGGSGPLAVHARYKRGWSRYKLGAYAEAEDDFLAVLAAELPPGGLEAASGPRRQLLEDTLGVLALALDHQGGVRVLDAALGRRPLPFAALLYQGLGEHYLRKERFVDAAEAFLAYGRRHPADVQAALFAARAAEAYAAGGFPSLLWPARERLAADYGPGSPFWAGLDETARGRVGAAIAPHLEALARRAHAAFQAGEAPAAEAERRYRALLEAVPAEARGPHRFLLGELLRAAGRTREALAAYEAAAWADPPHADAAAAGYTALALLDGPLRDSDRGRARFVADARRFLDRFPQAPRQAEVRARLAEALLESGRDDEAVAAAAGLLDAPAPLRARGLAVIGETRARTGDWAGAEAAWRAALEADPSARAVRARLALALYRQAEALRDGGRLAEAAAAFLRVARELPDSGLEAPARFDAAALLIRLERWPEAAEALEALRADSPDHPLAARVPEKLALAYEHLGRRTEAARELLRVAAASRDEAVARAARLHAAELLAAAGARREAIDVLRDYVARHPRPLDEALEARWRLAGLYAEAGDAERRAIWLRRLLSAYRREAAGASDAAHTLAARAALALGDIARARFEAVRLRLPLRASLARKREALEEAVRHYETAARTGVAGAVTEAAYRVGELYRRLAADVLASERPAGLDALARAQYEVLLEEQALPFEDRAVELHAANLARAREGVWDRWVAASLEALRALDPAHYDRREKVEHHVDVLDPTP